MRTCQNCGKANQPTRKYCIRCGKSLIRVKPEKKEESPKIQVPEVGTVTTAASFQAGQGTTQTSVSSSPPPSPTTEDKWVRPSEVSRDRVRSSRAPKVMSEMEKARQAFERAKEVGIEEDSSGIVESRMVRASEVRELLEHRQEIMDAAMTPEEPPLPPQEIPHDSLDEVPKDTTSLEEPKLSARVSHEFRSSRYESDDLDEIDFEITESEIPESESKPDIIDKEKVATCPNCGTVHGIDSFEYPNEVYSAMGTARLKHAKMLVVKGNGQEASRFLQIAISLFMKAENKTNLEEARRLLESVSLSWD
ncbi:MAG: hypothetical protein GF411_03900 [Candidatus Lokiarchaeota archaeon]|nr:hypothetical protein [Candidatus Lokiarchaeota archaeon]